MPQWNSLAELLQNVWKNLSLHVLLLCFKVKQVTTLIASFGSQMSANDVRTAELAPNGNCLGASSPSRSRQVSNYKQANKQWVQLGHRWGLLDQLCVSSSAAPAPPWARQLRASWRPPCQLLFVDLIQPGNVVPSTSGL